MTASGPTDLAMLFLQSSIVLGLAGAANFALRHRAADLRHLIWVIAFGLLLIVPPAARWLPKIEVPAAPSAWMPDSIRTVTGQWIEAAPLASPEESGSRSTANGSSTESGAARSASGVSLSWRSGLTTTYWLVAGALLLRLLLVLVKVQRRFSDLPGIEDRAIHILVAELANHIGVRREIRLRRDDRPGTPWTWGVVRPVIVLPSRFEGWPLRDRRNALIHEIAHIRRLDFISAMLAQLCLALYWFQPLVWFAERARRREAEYASDDRVVGFGVSPPDYANQLLGIARSIRHAPPSRPVTAMARPGEFLSRVARILDPKARRVAMRRSTRVYAVAVAALLALPLILLESRPAVSQDARDIEQILSSGPATEAELDRALDVLLDGGQEDRARSLLVQWLTAPDESFADCVLCARLIDQRDGSANAVSRRSTLMAAFGEMELMAQSQADPELLMRIIYVLSHGESGAADDLSMYYLAQARALGALSDTQKMMAASLLSRVGQYDAALALIKGIHENPASDYYQSPATQQWIRFIEERQELMSRIEQQLSPADGQSAPATYEYLPAYKQAPLYPADAAERNAEGRVVVEYTVTSTGRTRDPVIVSSTDSVFDRSALASVASFRYLPRVQNGVPVEVPGVRSMIVFRPE